MGFFLGVDQHLIAHSGRDAKKTVVGDMLGPEYGLPQEIFICGSCLLSQSIGRGRISREGLLVVRESRERRDKIFAKKKPFSMLA